MLFGCSLVYHRNSLSLSLIHIFRNKKMSFIGRIITALIWVLLFLLGIEVGSNPRIISGLQIVEGIGLVPFLLGTPVDGIALDITD